MPFGLWLLLLLIIQIISGCGLLFSSLSPFTASLGFKASIFLAYCHNIGASLIFIALYLHLLQKIFRRTYKRFSTSWIIGMVMMIIMFCVVILGQSLKLDTRGYHGLIVIKNVLNSLHITHFANPRTRPDHAAQFKILIAHIAGAILTLGISIPHIMMMFPGSLKKKLHQTIARYCTTREFLMLLIFIIAIAYMALFMSIAEHNINAEKIVWYIAPFYMLLIYVANPKWASLTILSMFLLLIALPLKKLINYGAFTISKKIFRISTFLWIISLSLPPMMHAMHVSYKIIKIVGMTCCCYYLLYFVMIFLLRIKK